MLMPWFDNRTMRVIRTEEEKAMYLGYAAIIPQRSLTDYRKKDDLELPLSQRINHGLRLPNRYRPGEWYPLRYMYPAPITTTDENGVAHSTRAEAQPVSWFSVAKGSFGALEGLEKKMEQEGWGVGFRPDPEDWDDSAGLIDDSPSPLNFLRVLAWWMVCLLPPNWVQYPYLPWVPWRPFKISLSDLPGRKIDTTNMYFHHSDMRPTPSTMHPLWRKWFRNDQDVKVRSLTDRDKDIASDWPIWSVGVKKFPHFYKEKETMVVLQGIATVKSPKGKPITIKKGDLVHFPQDMTVDWDVKEHFMAHYMFHTNT
mmetsp:Transcript_46302/g.112726  ORF Transcript_46302/g.112726 Transcript_46302/m.112726 type:complete len:312 (-) Transcript_46302:14-949(-)